MKQTPLIRAATLIAVLIGAFVAFAAGLHIMNVREEWALPVGASICIAAPLFAGAKLWAMIKEDGVR